VPWGYRRVVREIRRCFWRTSAGEVGKRIDPPGWEQLQTMAAGIQLVLRRG
jgi:hypothetical protein